VASRGIGQYIRQHFLDTTFRACTTPNAFDMALLIPYFIVLILLASTVCTAMCWYTSTTSTEKIARLIAGSFCGSAAGNGSASHFINEQFVWSGWWMRFAACSIRSRSLTSSCLTIQPTRPSRRLGLVEQYAARGFPITYHHRPREGFKAGALAEGMLTAQGEFIAIFDADFVPPEDFFCEPSTILPTENRNGCKPGGLISTATTRSPEVESHSAGWTFRAGTFRTGAQWRVFQFQWNRGRVAV